MKYDIHFRSGATITVESKRTLDEISDFFIGEMNSNHPATIWGVLADGDDPTALVSIIDVIAVVPVKPAPTPSIVRDADGDIWKKVNTDAYRCLGNSAIGTRSLSQIARSLSQIDKSFGPVEVLTSQESQA